MKPVWASPGFKFDVPFRRSEEIEETPQQNPQAKTAPLRLRAARFGLTKVA